MTGHLTPLEVEVLVSDARSRAAELAKAVRLTRAEIEVVINEGRAWRNAELVCVCRTIFKVFANMKTKFRRAARPTVTAFTLALAVTVNSSEAAPELAATCPSNFSVLTVSSLVTVTESQSFIDVPESGVRFTQGGSRADCVTVSLSAEVTADPSQAVLVRALLDGAAVCHPNQSFVGISTFNGAKFAAATVNFVCAGVTPGTHTINLQFGGRIGGRQLSLRNRTVTVHHFR